MKKYMYKSCHAGEVLDIHEPGDSVLVRVRYAMNYSFNIDLSLSNFVEIPKVGDEIFVEINVKPMKKVSLKKIMNIK